MFVMYEPESSASNGNKLYPVRLVSLSVIFFLQYLQTFHILQKRSNTPLPLVKQSYIAYSRHVQVKNAGENEEISVDFNFETDQSTFSNLFISTRWVLQSNEKEYQI